MGTRPTDWHVLDLDDDPTPGDPERVKQLARELHDFADDVADALRQIKGMAGEDALLRWAGKTAKAFQDEFEEVPKNLKKLQRSYDLAGDALAAYWPKLERAQSLADKALAKGREAQSDLTAANGRLDSANSWVDRATKKTEEYDEKEGKEKPDESEVRAATRNATDAKSARASAQTAVDNAQGGLEAAKKMAADAKKMREDAASEAKDKLEDASDAGIQNRKWWEKAVDWVKDNWDTIVTVCKVIVAVLGIVVLIIGGPLAWVVLAAALVVLADTLVKYMNGEASLWDVAFAALDCIPGMKGLTTLGGLARGLKGLKGGMAAVKGGLKSMSAGIRGLAQAARTTLGDAMKGAFCRLKNLVSKGPTDPVDLATGRMYLEHTDVNLAGALPLAFTRRVDSAYRLGWWFGPSWSSTVDQRLEIDEDGVLFVTEDGLILSYEHPADAAADVLPDDGPRWPLTLTETGAYSVSDPRTGLRRTFLPPREGIAPVAEVSDRNGNNLTFEYDETGAPTGIRHSCGYHLKITTDGAHITALHLVGASADGSDQLLIRYDYTAGNLTEVTDSCGTPFRYAYDASARVVTCTDTNRRRYDYSYDEQNRCVREGGEAGHLAFSIAYGTADPESGHRVTTVADPTGTVWEYHVNARSQVVAEVNPLGHTTRYQYDENQQLLARTDPLGHRTSFTYDRLGCVTRIVRPDGLAWTASYNALCLPENVEEPDGVVWTQTYDERGNRLTVTDPVGATTGYAYDDRGNLAEITDPAGGRMLVRSDPAGLPIEVVDPLGASTRFRHDSFGRLVEVVDPLDARTRLSWTLEGRLASRIHPSGATETWAYDGEGNCVRQRNAGGVQSVFAYTHFDLMSTRTDAGDRPHRFEHDHMLRLTRVTNPLGLTWSYEYDAAGRLVAETDFDERTIRYAYDAAGRLTMRTNGADQRITYAYDTLGNVVNVETSDGQTTFEYDPCGRLTAAAGGHARLRRERDEVGRITTETVNGRTVTYQYDVCGRAAQRLTPMGFESTWTYDPAGNRTSLQSSRHTLEFLRDALGRETGRRLGDALSLTQSWSADGRLTEQVLESAAGVDRRRGYTYRPDGHVVRVDDSVHGQRQFDVDPAGRVNVVRARDWTEHYDYDLIGNQTRSQWPAALASAEATGTRDYAGSRVIRAGRIRYEYDRQGRIVLRRKTRISRRPDVWRYTWDDEDRLTQVVTPDGTRWQYLYDPLGRRIAKQRLAGDGSVDEQTDFTWDGATLIEQTTTSPDLPNPVTVSWEYDGLHPLAQSERITDAAAPQDIIDERFFTIVTDLVGSPTELAGEDGSVAWHARSTLWGATAWNRDATAYTPLRFPGQYFDPETQLHYNFHRHYDPDTGRYTAPDPLGLAPAPNAYAYVPNPYTWADPLGLARCTHYADVSVHNPDGSIRVEYSLRSGYQTPQEQALGWPNGAMASHTENRAARMSGGSPTRPIPGDPYANLAPVGPGDSVVLNGTRPPCPQCMGAMNRAAEETGANFVYMWGNGNWWQAGRPLG